MKLFKKIKKFFKNKYNTYFDGLGLDFNFSKNTNNMATIVINGQRFDNVAGNNINIIGDKVMVDGVVIQSDLKGIVKIQFEGDVANVNATHLDIVGNVNGKVDTTHLKVSGDIKGNVDTTHLSCRDIYANNISSTFINCKNKNKLD